MMDFSIDYSADPEAAIIDAKVIVEKVLDSDEKGATLSTNGIRREDIKAIERTLGHVIRKNGFSRDAQRDIVKDNDIEEWPRVKRCLQALRYTLGGISDEAFLSKNEQDMTEIMEILNTRCGHCI